MSASFALTGSAIELARSAEWYQTEGSNCSGDQSLGAAVSAITGGGVALQAGTGPGKYFVQISANDLNSYAQNPEKIQNTKSLDASSAKTLRNLFLSTATDAKVPSFVNIGTSVSTGLLLPPAIGTAAGLVFNYLFSKIDAATSTVHDSGLLIADGGEVYKRSALLKRKSDDNIFMLASTEYRVTVGNEKRMFVVDACVYPVAVTVSEFDTTGQFNNKIIKPVGGVWKQWDIDDQKFDSDFVYTYVYQAGGYFYFEGDEVENNAVVGKNLYRISLFGGPFSTMDYNTRPNGPWKNFYLKVIAK